MTGEATTKTQPAGMFDITNDSECDAFVYSYAGCGLFIFVMGLIGQWTTLSNPQLSIEFAYALWMLIAGTVGIGGVCGIICMIIYKLWQIK